MLLLNKTKKHVYSMLISLCVCALFSQNVHAANGCRYQGRVYYNRATNPPNNKYEYYTNESWIQFSSNTSCNSVGNQSATYVLSSTVTNRTAKGGRCYVNYANTYTIGSAVTFPRTYQCPIDNLIIYLMIAILPLVYYSFRKQFLIKVK
ncbi:hypothetical protein [Pedobacter sp. R20-19]|uniref:hypothetical protein n=1 Tax=Pedobacter sp. R20-19 TaxID=1270196 RepID=UPI000493154E|nr:hypothetical protein [Pedobacter sp. R20-19]